MLFHGCIGWQGCGHWGGVEGGGGGGGLLVKLKCDDITFNS